MAANVIMEWEGREYEHAPKSADWYWSLGIIAIAGSIASILFGNLLLTLLIVIAASVIALHAAKVPPLHRFRLIETGIMIGDDLHLFEQMTSFSIFEDVEGVLPPILSIKMLSWHSPHLVIPLVGVDAEAVYVYLLQHIEEGDHKHTFTDLVAAWLGF